MKRIYRQGDVLLELVADMPSGGKELKPEGGRGFCDVSYSRA